MAQLILGLKTDEILAVLADGVHPGKKVVRDPGVWDSPPLANYKIIRVPGEDPSEFEPLMRRDIDPHLNVKRARILDISVANKAILDSTRELTLSLADVSSKSNPDGTTITPP